MGAVEVSITTLPRPFTHYATEGGASKFPFWPLPSSRRQHGKENPLALDALPYRHPRLDETTDHEDP